MTSTEKRDSGELPPVPGPDSWSPAEAADWDPDDEAPDDGDRE